MGQLDTGPLRLRHRFDLDVWELSTVHLHHGERWYVHVPVPVYWQDRREPAFVFENAFMTLAWMIEHNREID